MTMEKKTYKKPTAKVVELDTESLLAQSPTPSGQTPSGYSVNYDNEEQVPTISESIWDR